MSQNPNGPNYDPYGPNPNPSNPNYPAAPGTAYGGQPLPSGPNAGYPPYQPSSPQINANPNTPNSAYPPYQVPNSSSNPNFNQPNSGYPPYPAGNPPSGPNLGTPNSSYGPYGNPYAPPPPMPDTNPYDPYARTAMSQQNISNPGYPAYTPMPQVEQTPILPPPPQSNEPRKSRVGLIVGLVIALIVIFGGAIGFVGYSNHQSTLHANATATATAANVASTAQAKNIQATSTAVANTYPFSNNLVLNDPMVDNTKGVNWDNSQADDCIFSGSAYHVSDDQADTYNPCFAVNTNYTNFTFQAEMVLNQGNDNSDSGLLFRADKNSNKFYRFAVDDQGGCSVLVSVDTTGTNTRDLKDCEASQFNSGLGVTNTVAVVARGDQLSFYINQQLVTTVSDSTYSHGQIGFAVGNQDSKTSEAIFTNVKVWQLLG